MKPFPTDKHTSYPIDQNLYFTQNLPKKNPRTDMKIGRKAEDDQKLGEHKAVMLILRWILMIIIYPLHFIFELLPAFLEKHGSWLFAKIAFYAVKTKNYLYKTIWSPVARLAVKIFNIVFAPVESVWTILSNLMKQFWKKIAFIFGRVFSQVKKVNISCQRFINNALDFIVYATQVYYYRIWNLVIEVRQLFN